ncbi:hypothetical protein C8J56DRAFT_908519 [Mycena floridula]|nr:hypothetical protein C8J56DRAFT_908519 [Mycena floridula]
MRSVVKDVFVSAPARVYTLRALLLSCVITMLSPWLTGLSTNHLSYFTLMWLTTAGTICHHTLVLFPGWWNITVVDLLLFVVEYWAFTMVALSVTVEPTIIVMICINAGLLLVSLIFRIVAILASRNRIRFDLLAGCRRVTRQYTPGRILLGRSLFRPLIRGESRIIAVIRACILTVTCLGVPLFGIYTIIIIPMQSQIMQQNIMTDTDLKFAQAPDLEDITITMVFVQSKFNIPSFGMSQPCHISTDLLDLLSPTAICPFMWIDDREVVLTVNFSDPSSILYVRPGQGNPSDVRKYGEAIPLISGSHLSAILSNTQRQIFSKSGVAFLGLTKPTRSFTSQEILLVQPDPFPPNSGSDTASLRIRLRGDEVSILKITQDHTDVSVLTAFATFGGFWTFVNGAFAMFFGANLLYFLLRRRPLSALGLVHIFGRRGLVRKWHQDFPALYTEGGLPGSESAGIVAFIRERLVDLDEEGESDEKDIESQKSSPHTAYPIFQTQAGTTNDGPSEKPTIVNVNPPDALQGPIQDLSISQCPPVESDNHEAPNSIPPDISLVAKSP